MTTGLYIHIPFCHRRCNYCDFYLTTNLNIVSNFIQALKKEIILYSEKYNNVIIDSIFFGGGTPSILSLQDYDNIFSCLRDNFRISEKSEVTIECNPEDIIADKSKFRYLNKSGINRFSIGVQSFIDNELKKLSRLHSASQAIESVMVSKKILDNVNIDIIYSLQDQTINDIEYNLKMINDLDINHVSAYTLIVEKGTLIYKQYEKKNQLDISDRNSDLFYEFFSEKLTEMGFNHYEVSNYTKTGYESKHNLKYWNFENYLGLGPSSHSFINNQRFENVRSVSKYINKLNSYELPITEKTDLSKSQLKNDYFISVLRSKGINFRKYKLLFNEDFKVVYQNLIKTLTNLNLATISDTHFKLNQKGFALADEITLKFIT